MCAGGSYSSSSQRGIFCGGNFDDVEIVVKKSCHPHYDSACGYTHFVIRYRSGTGRSRYQYRDSNYEEQTISINASASISPKLCPNAVTEYGKQYQDGVVDVSNAPCFDNYLDFPGPCPVWGGYHCSVFPGACFPESHAHNGVCVNAGYWLEIKTSTTSTFRTDVGSRLSA